MTGHHLSGFQCEHCDCPLDENGSCPECHPDPALLSVNYAQRMSWTRRKRLRKNMQEDA